MYMRNSTGDYQICCQHFEGNSEPSLVVVTNTMPLVKIYETRPQSLRRWHSIQHKDKIM